MGAVQVNLRAASAIFLRKRRPEAFVLTTTGKKTDDLPWVGRSIERIEDLTLLAGRGRYFDDIGVPPGTLHAAILRSAHAHAVIRAIRTDEARLAEGVTAVITAAHVTKLST